MMRYVREGREMGSSGGGEEERRSEREEEGGVPSRRCPSRS